MTQEEKQLVFKDLCARLPYGVKLLCANGEIVTLVNPPITIQDDCWNFKPYLRPISSMTEEEEDEYWNVVNLESPEIPVGEIASIETIALCSTVVLDWLLSKGFDVRCLIPMGLALEAKEGMYV